MGRIRLLDDGEAPDGHHAERVSDREAVAAEVAALLAGQPRCWSSSSRRSPPPQVFFPGRERSRPTVRFIHETRVALHELGRRMVAAGHFGQLDDFGMLLADGSTTSSPTLRLHRDPPGAARPL